MACPRRCDRKTQASHLRAQGDTNSRLCMGQMRVLSGCHDLLTSGSKMLPRCELCMWCSRVGGLHDTCAKPKLKWLVAARSSIHIMFVRQADHIQGPIPHAHTHTHTPLAGLLDRLFDTDSCSGLSDGDDAGFVRSSSPLIKGPRDFQFGNLGTCADV